MWIFPEPRCERCGSAELRTYGGRRKSPTTRERYHRCAACGARFRIIYTTAWSRLDIFNSVDTSPDPAGPGCGTVLNVENPT